jgi:hypothetical protein
MKRGRNLVTRKLKRLFYLLRIQPLNPLQILHMQLKLPEILPLTHNMLTVLNTSCVQGFKAP